MKKIFLLSFVSILTGWIAGSVWNSWLATPANPALNQNVQDQVLAQDPLPASNFQPSATPSPTPEYQPVTILFGGDLMFDRHIRSQMQKNGIDHPLKELREYLNSFDVVVANLEGPITTNPSRSVNSVIGSPSNFIFTFDPSIIPMLEDHNIKIVCLGNNHINNFGVNGAAQTKELLQASSVAFFGYTGAEQLPEERILFQNFGPHRVAFVNYNQFTPGGYPAALDDIAHAKASADIVIMMTHWGNEYVPTANATIQDQAHAFIDAGADVIIGTHPHVIQNVEVYKSKTIYYSLGNFVFDQYFSAETTQGLLVSMEIAEDKILSFSEKKIRLQSNGQTLLYAP